MGNQALRHGFRQSERHGRFGRHAHVRVVCKGGDKLSRKMRGRGESRTNGWVLVGGDLPQPVLADQGDAGHSDHDLRVERFDLLQHQQPARHKARDDLYITATCKEADLVFAEIVTIRQLQQHCRVIQRDQSVNEQRGQGRVTCQPAAQFSLPFLVDLHFAVSPPLRAAVSLVMSCPVVPDCWSLIAVAAKAGYPEPVHPFRYAGSLVQRTAFQSRTHSFLYVVFWLDADRLPQP